jgi:hypothetical protein
VQRVSALLLQAAHVCLCIHIQRPLCVLAALLHILRPHHSLKNSPKISPLLLLQETHHCACSQAHGCGHC